MVRLVLLTILSKTNLSLTPSLSIPFLSFLPSTPPHPSVCSKSFGTGWFTLNKLLDERPENIPFVF